jgi:hypothetical protein
MWRTAVRFAAGSPTAAATLRGVAVAHRQQRAEVGIGRNSHPLIMIGNLENLQWLDSSPNTPHARPKGLRHILGLQPGQISQDLSCRHPVGHHRHWDPQPADTRLPAILSGSTVMRSKTTLPA